MPNSFPNSEQYVLIGGKYCSLDGERAAQMKIRNIKTNTIHTLYAAPLEKTIKWITEKDGSSKGVSVILWSESSTLFAITNNSKN